MKSSFKNVWRLPLTLALALALASIAWLAPAQARVTAISMGPPTLLFDGRSFGSVGAYEQLRGTITGELDPLDPHNAVRRPVVRTGRPGVAAKAGLDSARSDAETNSAVSGGTSIPLYRESRLCG